MADNIIQSLFGLDPYQTQTQQQDALRQQAAAYANMAPQQRAAMSLYQAGGQLAGAGAEGLFGMVNPAVAKAQATEQAMMGLDMSNPQSILAKAQVTTDPRLRIQLQLLAQKMSEQQLDAQKKQSDIELAKAHAKYYGAGGSGAGGAIDRLVSQSNLARRAAEERAYKLNGTPEQIKAAGDNAVAQVIMDYERLTGSPLPATVTSALQQGAISTPATAIGGLNPSSSSAMSYPKVSPLQDKANLEDRLFILKKELADNQHNPTDVARITQNIADTEAKLVKYQGLPTRAAAEGAVERAKQSEKVVETTTPSGTAAFARAGESIGQAPAQFSPQVKGAVSQAEATGREVGQVAGKAQTELAGLDDQKTLVFSHANELLRHPGFQNTVGATLLPGMRFIHGSKETGFMVRFNQIKNGSFLDAYKILKGGGPITEVEGTKATDAMNRMSIATDEKEFAAAVKDFKDAVTIGFNKLKAQAAMSRQQPAQGNVEVWERGPDGKLRRVR